LSHSSKLTENVFTICVGMNQQHQHSDQWCENHLTYTCLKHNVTACMWFWWPFLNVNCRVYHWHMYSLTSRVHARRGIANDN